MLKRVVTSLCTYVYFHGPMVKFLKVGQGLGWIIIRSGWFWSSSRKWIWRPASLDISGILPLYNGSGRICAKSYMKRIVKWTRNKRYVNNWKLNTVEFQPNLQFILPSSTISNLFSSVTLFTIGNKQFSNSTTISLHTWKSNRGLFVRRNTKKNVQTTCHCLGWLFSLFVWLDIMSLSWLAI